MNDLEIRGRYLRLVLYVAVISLMNLIAVLAVASPSGAKTERYCGFSHQQPDTRRFARAQPGADVGEPRTVRMIYFAPRGSDRRADVVQHMKSEILAVQGFFADAMTAHGYDDWTFRVEKDAEGDPAVHQVQGQHTFAEYENTPFDPIDAIIEELGQAFDFYANIYLVVLEADSLGTASESDSGVGTRFTKVGGAAVVMSGFGWQLAAHELGHAFGLGHDFRDGSYIMSYGPGENRLSDCSAEFLAVHPYFNHEVQTEAGAPPTSEIISSLTYPFGSQNVPVEIRLGALSIGLHQVLLYAEGALMACEGLGGANETVVQFDYTGVMAFAGYELIFRSLSDSPVHTLYLEVVDKGGNVTGSSFELASVSPHQIASPERQASPVASLSFSPDGAVLASGAFDNQETVLRDDKVRLWDLATQMNLVEMDKAAGVAFSPEGARLATAAEDGTVSLRDAKTGAILQSIEGHAFGLPTLAFSPDGANLVFAGRFDETITLWNIRQNEIASLPGNFGTVTCLAFSPKGGVLASGASDGTIKLWDLESRKAIIVIHAHSKAVTSIAYSPHGTTLASGSFDATVKLWDVAANENIGVLKGHRDWVLSVAFSPDGQTLVSGAYDGSIKLWDVTTLLAFDTVGYSAPIEIVTFSPDGKILAAGANDGAILLWDAHGLARSRIGAITEVNIPDPNLRAAIAAAVNASADMPIRAAHMTSLIELHARDAKVRDLTGLERATNLTWLELWGNDIEDISPIAELTSLGLLDLSNNAISDISPLARLTNLGTLYIAENSIEDISALSDLTELSTLFLWDNLISDISPLSSLAKLTLLDVDDNIISDISPLLENEELGAGDTVLIYRNPLSAQSIDSYIPELEGRGVEVHHGSPHVLADVNYDGVVNILDLVSVAAVFRTEEVGLNEDVNFDGVVDMQDLVIVAQAINAVASPSARIPVSGNLTADDVKQWIAAAKSLPNRDANFKRGISVLRQLLASLTPASTALLPNYPNPFNPETWIPYQLADPGDVSLTIYDAAGRLIRHLDVGHQSAGYYKDKGKAGYWDGRSGDGEPVASGVYFYRLGTPVGSYVRRMSVVK